MAIEPVDIGLEKTLFTKNCRTNDTDADTDIRWSIDNNSMVIEIIKHKSQRTYTNSARIPLETLRELMKEFKV